MMTAAILNFFEIHRDIAALHAFSACRLSRVIPSSLVTTSSAKPGFTVHMDTVEWSGTTQVGCFRASTRFQVVGAGIPPRAPGARPDTQRVWLRGYS